LQGIAIRFLDGAFEQRLREVKPDDLIAPRGELNGVSTKSTGKVQHAIGVGQIERLLDKISLLGCLFLHIP
jgi:hypothetical protein